MQDGQIIHSNVIASQVDIHAQYGGVFPEVASRAHVEAISPVLDAALQGFSLDDMDAIAVTHGPGLPDHCWWASITPKGWRWARACR